MKKKLSAILLLALCILTACSAPSEPNEMERMLEKVEQGLGGEYKKQSVTKVYDFAFTDNQGNTLTMYICVTTYFAADPEAVTGLDRAALSAVFDPENTPLQKEFTVNGHSAAIYQDDEHAYLCWTTSPEASGVVEYAPGTLTEEEALRVVRSVYERPNPGEKRKLPSE